MKRLQNILWICLLCCASAVQAQEGSETSAFRSPFDFPLLVSANFGELRAGHFHGGLDIKTQGEVGKPVRCIADGYVSRASVTPGGFGQALYVTHPNGYTSVYGHIMKFASAVEEAVEAYQYSHETFSADLVFEPNQIEFKAGDVIALSGNEGYSFGPHLHLELHRTDTGELVDPLPFFTQWIKDTTPPRASAVVFYPQAGKGVVDGSTEKKELPVAALGKLVTAWGEMAVGLRAEDAMDGTSNRYGVRSVVLYVDSVEVFRSTVDAVLPKENRMINAWTDYEEYTRGRGWIMRSHVLPGTRLRMLHADENRGVVTIDEERDYRFCYVLSDGFGNTSTYRFTVRGRQQPVPASRPMEGRFLAWNRGNVIQEPGMELVVPRGMLYEDVVLHSRITRDTAALTPTYRLHDAPVPLHAGCPLLIALRKLPVSDTSKYYVARKSGRRWVSVGGTYTDGWMKTSINQLGTYSVALDTVPPKVVPLGQSRWKTGVIRFKVTDAETGVRDFKVRIDGRFALFGYSSKNAELWMKHPERLEKGVSHRLELVVTDDCGNETRQEYVF